MQWISGLFQLFAFLFAGALLFNIPLILIVFLARNRLDPRFSRLLIAAGFAVACAYLIWRMEWFDVWRHGIPSVGYMVGAFGPYTAAAAACGWGVGRLVTPRARTTQY